MLVEELEKSFVDRTLGEKPELLVETEVLVETVVEMLVELEFENEFELELEGLECLVIVVEVRVDLFESDGAKKY